MSYFLLCILLLSVHTRTFSQDLPSTKSKRQMKLNAGFITSKLTETKAFYTEVLGFGITFENEFYVLLHTPEKNAEISFLLPGHPSQHELFQKPFLNQGAYLTLEVDDVDKFYQEIKLKNIRTNFEIRDEPWGDRHFGLQDPNGIGIDVVTYKKPE